MPRSGSAGRRWTAGRAGRFPRAGRPLRRRSGSPRLRALPSPGSVRGWRRAPRRRASRRSSGTTARGRTAASPRRATPPAPRREAPPPMRSRPTARNRCKHGRKAPRRRSRGTSRSPPSRKRCAGCPRPAHRLRRRPARRAVARRRPPPSGHGSRRRSRRRQADPAGNRSWRVRSAAVASRFRRRSRCRPGARRGRNRAATRSPSGECAILRRPEHGRPAIRPLPGPRCRSAAGRCRPRTASARGPDGRRERARTSSRARACRPETGRP